jgi:phenylacetate-coenzyme A ligase PaaK-like adenylate-forming protein/acyl-CoA reductase-like NAD-dependent aldehyde dehydrogenase
MRYIFGTWCHDETPLTIEEVRKICNEAHTRRDRFAAYPADKVLRVLDRMRALWLDRGYEKRKSLEARLSLESGFSPEMVRLGFNDMNVVFNPSFLQKKLSTELRGIPKTGDWCYNPGNSTAMSWQPLGTVLHILSGNVFTVAAGSLAAGLMTGNITILKMSSQEQLFLPKLIESLVDCDDEGVVAQSVAFVDFTSADTEVIAEFKKQVDGIVVWGGEEAVRAYRNDLPARTRLILFGPRISAAVLTAQGLSTRAITDVADRLADDIALWDQNACTAPQACFVEGKERALELGRALASSLEKVSATLPPGEMDFETAVEIRKLRSISEIAEARGEGALFEAPRTLDWTVMVDSSLSMDPSPLHRTIRLIAFEKIDEVLESLGSLRGYLQTVGLLAGKSERPELARRLALIGALRIVEPGEMSDGEVDDPHDGLYDLPLFVNLVFSRERDDDGGYEPIDFMSPAGRQEVIDSRLRVLVDRARHSEFYGRRLDGLVINTTDDLEKIPLLKREEMEAHIPPRGMGLCTGPWTGGYVSRSGGSTGEPTFSIYDGHDWDQMIGNAVRLFRAVGLKAGDRLANCFITGNLYGSFVSFDHINCRLGVTSFAFGNEVRADVFLNIWKKFNLNVVMGIPTTVAPLLREARSLDTSFTIEKILYAGSPLSPADFDFFHRELGAQVIGSIIGANDGGQIAFQCPAMKGTHLHHTIDDFNFIEIVDDQGKRLPDGTAGWIAITSLMKYAFPLIRYVIGDEGRMVEQHCSCGRTLRLLEHRGRIDDVVTIGLINVRHRDIHSALKELPLSEIQLVAKCDDRGEHIVLRIECHEESEELRKLVHDSVREKVEMIRYRMETGDIRSLEIEFHKPGALPRNPRSDKIKRVIDERVEKTCYIQE